MLKNLIEDIVDHALPSIWEGFPKACKCEKCVLDVKALALNNLRLHYTVSENGQLYAKALYELDLQYKSDVVQELYRAIEIVQKNPRHRAD